MPTDQHVEAVTLKDGRRLAFAEYGDALGMPAVFFHGIPGSRLQAGWALAPLDGLHGVRLIAPDRPGFGASTPRPGRTFTDTASDVVELVDQLGLERVRLLGVSGGAAPALAAAAALGERVERTLLVSPMGPYERRGDLALMESGNRAVFQIARRAPWLLGWLQKLVAARPRTDSPPSADSAAMTRLANLPGVAATMERDMAEALRHGYRAMAHELRLHLQPWGFALTGVTAPVHLWHGLDDGNAPIALARRLADRLPSCRMTAVAGGHLLPDTVREAVLPALRA